MQRIGRQFPVGGVRPGALVVYPKRVVTLPNDGADAKPFTFKDVRGHRLWTLDWIEVEMGKELDFGGMKARWVNWLDMMGISTEPGAANCKNITVGRHTQFGFDKGRQVFLLDDPEGNSWAMKSFSLITHPDQKFEEAGTLGSRLKLSPGLEVPSAGARPGPDPHAGQGRHRSHHAGRLRQQV